MKSKHKSPEELMFPTLSSPTKVEGENIVNKMKAKIYGVELEAIPSMHTPGSKSFKKLFTRNRKHFPRALDRSK